MYCKMCGTENQENANFCYKCGEKLVENTIFSNENEIVTEAKENKNIELDEFQKKYIEGLKDKLYKIDELESDELERIYLKSKSYNISQEYIDSIIMQKKEDKDKLFAYITMLYDENSKFDLSDEEEEEIINFGQRLKLSEENVREYLENYNRQNNITEKADLYEKIVKSYIGECFSEVFKEDLGNDKNALQEERRIVKSGLDEEEYKIVERCVKKNVKNVLGVIEKKYSSLGNENLSENQMSDIVMYGERYDLETADVTLLISIVEKRIGVFDKKRTKFVDDFKKRIDDLLSEEIVFAGKKRVLEGKYFLEDYIYYLVDDRIEEYEDMIIEAIDPFDSLNMILSTIIEIYGGISDDVLEFAQQIEMENELLSENGGVACGLYQYLEEKCKDIVTTKYVFEKVNDIADMEKVYRELRKENRGRWSGGGVGLGGAIGGAINAEILNTGSGLMHSVVNSFENANMDNKVKKQKEKMVDDIRRDLRSNFCDKVDKMEEKIYDIVYKKHPEAFWKKDNEHAQKIFNQYITETQIDKKQEIAWSLIKADPENLDFYYRIFMDTLSRTCKDELLDLAETLAPDIEDDLRKRIDTSLDNIIHQFDIQNKENSVVKLYEYIQIRYEEECVDNKFLENIYVQLLRKKRGDYAQAVDYVIEFDNQYQNGKICIDLKNKIIEELEILLTKISTNQEQFLQEEINKIKYSDSELHDLVNIYHKWVNTYIEEEVQKTIVGLPIDNLEKATETKEKIELIYETFFVEGKQKIAENILQKIFEKKLEKKNQLESLKSDQQILKKFETAWEVHLIELERLFEETIDVEECTVYDYNVDVVKSTIKGRLITKEPGILYQDAEKAKKVREKVKQITALYDSCNINSYKDVNVCLDKIMSISQNTGFGKAIIEDLKNRLPRLEEKSRTVMGILYDTIEEADVERAKIVSGKKFNTLEEAEAERRKEAIEWKKIIAIEEELKTDSKILIAIKKQKFSTEKAKIKEKAYEAKVLQFFYKNKNQKKELEKEAVKSFLCFVFGILSVLIFIVPFFRVGWIGKIIIFGIWSGFYLGYDNGKEMAEMMQEDVKEVEFIKKEFIINGNVITLKGNNKEKI